MTIIISIMAILFACFVYRKNRRGRGRVAKLIYIELIYNLVIKYLIGNMHLPSALNYVTDLILIWILLEYFHQKKSKMIVIPKKLSTCIWLFFFASLASYIINIYSPVLLLWGMRNNFRFLVFAMMCVVYLRKDDIERIMSILYGFLFFNVLVVTHQALFTTYSMAAKGDFISGLFSNGLERGGNASLNWLMCIVCTYYIVKYLNKDGKLDKVLISVAGSMYMAAVAEIKLFFIQIIIIGLLALMLCRKSFKTIVISVGGFVGIVFAIRWMYELFPEFKNFFNIESVLLYVTRNSGYGSSIRNGAMGIDRMTAIPFIMNNFLITPIQRLFGIGLGNADYSGSFAFLTSSFYRQYGLLGYQYFYYAFLFLETGFVGLIMYINIILNYMSAALSLSDEGVSNRTIKYFTIIISVMLVIMMISNVTMKIEASGYMVHCVLCFAFLQKKEFVSKSEMSSR